MKTANYYLNGMPILLYIKKYCIKNNKSMDEALSHIKHFHMVTSDQDHDIPNIQYNEHRKKRTFSPFLNSWKHQSPS